jgi:hypothetical protein
MKPEDALAHAHGVCNHALDWMTPQFKPGAKFTLIVRYPDEPLADLVCTNDKIGEIVKVLARREAAEAAGEISRAEIDRAIADLERKNGP